MSKAEPPAATEAPSLRARIQRWLDAREKLGAKGRKTLKSVHVALACVWLGSAVALVLLQAINTSAYRDSVPGVTLCLKLIDDFLIIPSAAGSLLTGIVYGVWTKWGFFQFHWVTLKWIATVAFILFGAFLLGPWINGMHALAQSDVAAALQSPDYQHSRLMVLIWGGLQTVGLVGLVFLSIFKPWGRREGR